MQCLSLSRLGLLSLFFAGCGATVYAQSEIGFPSLPQSAAVQKEIKEIRRVLDAEPWRLLAGSPKCNEVLQRKGYENRRVVSAAFREHPELAKSYRVFSHPLPAPESALINDAAVNARVDRDHVSGCMASMTKVMQLRFVDGVYRAQVVPIMEVEAATLVLSNTRLVTRDPRYQMNCWAEVAEVVRGGDSDIQYDELHFVVGSKPEVTETLFVKPRHPFVVQFSEWRRATVAHLGNGLVSTGANLQFIRNGAPARLQTARTGFDQRKFVNFSLVVPSTYAYYVGESTPDLLTYHK